MSVLSRHQPVQNMGWRDQVMNAAQQAGPAVKQVTATAAQQAAPVARQVAPIARNAGTTVRQSRDGAIAWASPYVDTARAWAAPRLEQSAVALNEQIAPAISEALIAAAHKIDVTHPKRHRLRTSAIIAGSVAITAAGAYAAYSMRQRSYADDGFTASTAPTVIGEGMSAGMADGGRSQAEGDTPEAESNGHPPTT